MKITCDVELNLKTKEVTDKVSKATLKSLKNTVVDITNDTIKGSPVKTGNNRRSIKYEIGPGGDIDNKSGEAAIYSTSGYGGYLETGTVKMAARPYFKPALDRNIHKLPEGIKTELQGRARI